MTTISLSDTTEAARQYWRDVLEAGGFTAIPRWTLEPVPGVASQEAVNHEIAVLGAA